MGLNNYKPSPFSCCCIGKQGNDKYCPCEMRNRDLDGDYQNHAPVTQKEKEKLMEALKWRKN